MCSLRLEQEERALTDLRRVVSLDPQHPQAIVIPPDLDPNSTHDPQPHPNRTPTPNPYPSPTPNAGVGLPRRSLRAHQAAQGGGRDVVEI